MPRPLPSPQDLDRMDLDAVLRDASRKQGFVTPMFEHIAPRYDAFTRLFSFGMDAGWKRDLLSGLGDQDRSGRLLLDLACGTGDLALALQSRWPRAQVVGIDAATRMIAHARARVMEVPGDRRPAFEVGDLAATGQAVESVDLITAGYAFRNVPSLDAALEEARRVLRPGGSLHTLDFYRPAFAPWRVAFLWYLRLAGGLVGWWWHRAPVIYAYIAASIDTWVSVPEYEEALDRHGFAVAARRTYLGGGVAAHHAVRR